MDSSKFIFASIETTAFSGATLLAMLLGNSPDIATIGEVSGLVARNDPNTYLCSCGERIIDCDFWKTVTEVMKQKGHDFSVTNFNTQYNPGGLKIINRLRIGSVRNNFVDRLRDRLLFAIPNEKKKIIQYVERNVDFVESVLEMTNKKIFLDSSKSRMLIRALPKFSDFDVRVIHLIRRVEGVVSSSLRRDPNIDIAKISRDWVKRHRRLDVTLKSWPADKKILIRYEDLCNHTQQTLSRLYRFLGIQRSHRFLDLKVQPQHVVGNPMRLKPISEIKIDERWKSELSKNQLRLINRYAGKLNQKYGYEAN